jgi:adenylate cyclase
LHCFVAIREAVQQQAIVFTSNFGVIPTFKAGIHWGEVATGEIGSVKKDIVYSGDVLNTTARIVALCNQYNETLIISESMYEELKQAVGFQFNYIASPVLRGKKNPLGIYGVKTLF